MEINEINKLIEIEYKVGFTEINNKDKLLTVKLHEWPGLHDFLL